jgi:hypothetical protein
MNTSRLPNTASARVKANGGVYGYPAVLLLCCIIDALRNYVGFAKNTLRGAGFTIPA